MRASPGVTDLMLTIQAVSRLDALSNKLVLTLPASTKILVVFRDPGQSKVAYLTVDAGDQCMLTLRDQEHGGNDLLRISVTDPVDVAIKINDHFK